MGICDGFKNTTSVLIGSVILARWAFVVFFGGTRENAKIELEIFEVIWLPQTSYNVLTKNQEGKRKAQEAKKITDNDFKES